MAHGGNVWQGGPPARWQDHSANLRPEGMPDWVRRALEDSIQSAVYYPDPSSERGAAALARALGLPKECVLPTAGGISALDLATKRGIRSVLTVSPCFTEYAELAARYDIPVRSVSVLTDGHGIDTSLKAVCREVRAGDDVRLCSPMNPVGAAFPRENVLRLLRACEEKGAFLTLDEAFCEYCPDRIVRDLVTASDRLIIAGSLTKILAVPGVRIGYLCAAPKTIERLRSLRLTWEVSCFAEAILEALPDHLDEIARDARRNTVRREALRAALLKIGADVYPSEANFLLADLRTDARSIARKLREKGILARECMDYEGIADGHHLRLAVRTEEENTRLAEALEEAMACAENR